MILNPRQAAHHFRQGVMTLFATLTAVMMLAIPASAQEILFDPAVAASDIEEFEFSPDGTKIVMVAALDNGLGDQTYVAPFLTGVVNSATLVSPNGVGDNDGGVGWTPDGLSVVTRYTPTGTGNANEIFLLPADGSQTATQLTFGSSNAFDPQISGDGNSLFFSDGGSLFVTPIATASMTSAIQLNPGDISEIDTGSYAQHGSDIIFAGFAPAVPGSDGNTPENVFYRTAADGSTAATPTMISITNFPASLPLGMGTNADSMADVDFMQINPDGNSIVFRGDLTTDAQDELYSIPIAGGDAVSLLFGTLRDNFDLNYFKISPDGSNIAFVGDYLTEGVAEAFVVPVAGGVPLRVSDSAGFDQTNGFDVDFGGVDTLQFSPDGTSIYYLSDGGDNGRFRLFRVDNPLAAVPEPASLPLLFAAATFFLRRRR